jgi:hypothetical protein
MWSLGQEGWHGRPESGELAGGLGRGSGWGGSRVHGGSIWVLTCGGERTGRRARRKPAASVTGGVTPASWQLGPGNKRKEKLRGVLGEVRAAPTGGESGRSKGFTVGTKGDDNGGLVALCTRA